MIPVPLNVPPEGEPVNVTAAAFTQIDAGKPEKLTTGSGFTVMVTVAVLLHPFAAVPVTV